MDTFQVGDIVVCVNGKQYRTGPDAGKYLVTEGRVYQVVFVEVDGEQVFVRVVDIESPEYKEDDFEIDDLPNLYASRFVLKGDPGISPVIRKIRKLESKWKSRDKCAVFEVNSAPRN